MWDIKIDQRLLIPRKNHIRAYLGKDARLKRTKLRKQRLSTICRNNPSIPFCRHDAMPIEHDVYAAKVVRLNETIPVDLTHGNSSNPSEPSLSPISLSQKSSIPSWLPTLDSLSDVETYPFSPYDKTNHSLQTPNPIPSIAPLNDSVDSETSSSVTPSILVLDDENFLSNNTDSISDNIIDQSYRPSARPSVMDIATQPKIPVSTTFSKPSVRPKIEEVTLTPSMNSSSNNPFSPSSPKNSIKSLPLYAYPVLTCLLVTLIALVGYYWARQRRTTQTSLLDEARPRKLYLHALDNSTATVTLAHLNKDDNGLPIDIIDLTDFLDRSEISSISMDL
jgi:hypothetical protein